MTKTVYILGTGPSILDIKPNEWEYLKDKETISFATFPLKGKNTKYYYSSEWYEDDIGLLPLMSRETTLFLFNEDSIKLAYLLNYKKIRKIFKGPAVFSFKGHSWFEDEEKPHTIKECLATNYRQPLFRYRGQLCAVINIALIMGADIIKLVGIDMNSQRNFIDYLPKLEKHAEREQIMMKEKEEGRNPEERILDWNPNQIHSTACRRYFHGKIMRPVPEIIQELNKELQSENKYIYNCNPNSLLVNAYGMKYKEIIDE